MRPKTIKGLRFELMINLNFDKIQYQINFWIAELIRR